VSCQQSRSPAARCATDAGASAPCLNLAEFRTARAPETMRHNAQMSPKTSPTNPLVSTTSAVFSKCPQLIENASLSLICKSFDFNQSRTLSHSSPGSPLLPICSPKHTGGIPPVAQSSPVAGTVAPSTPSGSDLFVPGERRFRFFAVHIAHRTICNFRGLQCLMP
jgi:hypothetical protein